MARPALEQMLQSFVEAHPSDAARALEALPADEAAALLRPLPMRAIGPVVERLAPRPAAALLQAVGEEETRELLASVAPRQAAAILRNLEDAAREATLSRFEPGAARRIRNLLTYPDDTAGGMMEPQISTLREDQTAEEALAAVRRAPRHTLYYLYVTDRSGVLVGVLNLRDLMLAEPGERIAPLVRRQVVTVPASMPREEVVQLIRQRRFIALPVVDSEGFLLGVVKPDEILEALQEEAFGDLQKMVGAGEDEQALSPVSTVVKKRLPWLYVNLGTAFLAAAVVGIFEGTIERVTALAVLLPVVAGQGGNTGAQSLAVVMRGIALRELVPGSTPRLLRKEFLGALFNGVAVAIGTGAAVWAWDGRVGLVLVIVLAMIVNMTAAGLSGAAIPLVLRRLGRDPAQSASIFLTTVTDIVGFAAFLGFAVAFMSWLEAA